MLRMTSYFTIHDMPQQFNQIKRLVAICYDEQQAYECYNRIMKYGMEMTYIVLERVDTNDVGLIVGRVIIAEDWVRIRTH